MRKSPQNERPERVILHMDGDAFFVGVEVAKDQTLKGRAVVTGEERGIVSALSYEAKALGIVRGMPIYRVKKEFPAVIILPGDYASYAQYSDMMFAIVRRYADEVEEYSIDECFADLTGLPPPLRMTYRQIAERIKHEVNDELHLSVSLGLAPTKVLAKIASSWVKPNGLTVIDPADTKSFLESTLIEKVWGIGRQTSKFLRAKGIHTAFDLAAKDAAWIDHHLSKPYKTIWKELNGVLVTAVDPDTKTSYSSIQKTRTFHPATNERTFLLSQLSKHIEDACAKARHYRLVPKKVSIFLKTRDFRYATVSFALYPVTNSPEILITLACERFAQIHTPGVLYRTAGVTLHDLMPDTAQQADLFGESVRAGRFESIHRHIDRLEDKLGKHVVHLAATHRARSGGRIGTDMDDVDRDLLFL